MTEQIIRFSPAYNKTNIDPSKDYGIGAMSIWFFLRGDLATVQFNLGTNWHLEEDRQRLLSLGRTFHIPEPDPACIARQKKFASLFNSGPPYTREMVECDAHSAKTLGKPMGYDVGYHSPVALYEGQYCRTDCEFFPNGTCYYDGSSLRADDWARQFVIGGSDWLWPKLEEFLSETEARIKEQMEMQRNFT